MADRAKRRAMGAATGNRGGLNRNLYEEISLLYVACGEKMRGRACRVGGAKPAAGVRLPKGCRRSMDIAVGRPKGAATIEQVRHRAMGSAVGRPSGRRCGEATT